MESYDVRHLAWRRTGGSVVRSAADLYIGLLPGLRRTTRLNITLPGPRKYCWWFLCVLTSLGCSR